MNTFVLCLEDMSHFVQTSSSSIFRLRWLTSRTPSVKGIKAFLKEENLDVLPFMKMFLKHFFSKPHVNRVTAVLGKFLVVK